MTRPKRGVGVRWGLVGLGFGRSGLASMCRTIISAEASIDLASHLTVWPRGQIDTPRTSGDTFLFVGLYVGKAQNYMCFHCHPPIRFRSANVNGGIFGGSLIILNQRIIYS